MIHKILAGLILAASNIRENSYDQVAADASPGAFGFEQFYKKGLTESCREACKEYPELEYPVYLILAGTWNDGLDWAERNA